MRKINPNVFDKGQKFFLLANENVERMLKKDYMGQWSPAIFQIYDILGGASLQFTKMKFTNFDSSCFPYFIKTLNVNTISYISQI